MSETATIKYEIVTPRGKIAGGECLSVILPEPQGEIGILKSHIPLIAALGNGVMRFKTNAEEKRFFISKGFLEVKDNNVIILAEIAEKAEEIDTDRARSAYKRALARLDIASPESVMKPEERTRARRSKERAVARLKTAGVSIDE
ncbi:TPA: ATP synthase F1 subunit epsilon [bacterium]|nr:MAG: ATP synthase F1 subunit epsilon [Candidatus Hydrogenedentes bacterium CG1_02_42_14]PIU48137.1 MAG: ATP synthase F1 subunit epsilon [Candidatus Hydrogenedentes bacterium CG07_land_8_20_14_0_80_42_17]HBW47864.1 ATP synthase F1 subunit epsilon [bacterium]